MNIALDLLDDTIPDVRHVPATAEEDAGMLRTIIAVGVLQPILVRPSGNRFEIVLGRRRVRLAHLAGLAEIAAEVREMTDAEAIRAQVIENIQRARMNAIDQWRSVKQMLALGLGIADAAMAFGLTEREARRMELLASLHPRILELAEAEMPAPHDLAAIAAATHERQEAALKVPHAVMKRDVNWHIIARACRTESIPRGRAIFDVKLEGAVHWIEDFFAEPGSPEQFVTYNVAAFMAAQQAALAARVDLHRKRGDRMTLVECGRQDIVLPRGWTRTYMDHGRKPLRKPDGLCMFVAVSNREHDMGAIIEVVASPPPSLRRPDVPAPAAGRPGRAAAAATPDVSSPDVAAAEPQDEADEIERPAITQKGLSMIAAAKQQALRDHLLGARFDLAPATLVACLLLALTADNVTCAVESKWSREDLRDIARRLVRPDGQLDLPEDDESVAQFLAELTAEALARVLTIAASHDPRPGSGDAAEWIGVAIGADVALPRFDTEEFLATLSADELRSLARTADVSVPKLVRELRAALVGKLPGWRPTSFGAPGPKPERQERRRCAAELEDAEP